jgi:hypothetical protein
VETWAEMRRLRRAESVPIREIARRTGASRNTVRAALASDYVANLIARSCLAGVQARSAGVRCIRVIDQRPS